MEDAKARGMSEEDANAYSGIMALAEGLTEQLGAGITKKVGKSIAKKSSKEALKYFGLDIAENFIEEAEKHIKEAENTTKVAGQRKGSIKVTGGNLNSVTAMPGRIAPGHGACPG